MAGKVSVCVWNRVACGHSGSGCLRKWAIALTGVAAGFLVWRKSIYLLDGSFIALRNFDSWLGIGRRPQRLTAYVNWSGSRDRQSGVGRERLNSRSPHTTSPCPLRTPDRRRQVVGKRRVKRPPEAIFDRRGSEGAETSSAYRFAFWMGLIENGIARYLLPHANHV